VHVTEVFNFTCLLHNYIEGLGTEAAFKRQSIKCGCEYFVQLRKPSREPNAPWRITVCKLQHTNGWTPTQSSHLVCTQRGKKQFAPVLDAMVGQSGEVPTSSVTRQSPAGAYWFGWCTELCPRNLEHAIDVMWFRQMSSAIQVAPHC
jgi:hypothetical protein